MKKPLWLLGWLLLVLPLAGGADFLQLTGNFIQGSLITGRTEPGTRVLLNGQPLRVSPAGVFVIGFDRDAGAQARLEITYANGAQEIRVLTIIPRSYAIQRIEGLAEERVTPPTEVLERIRQETALVARVREHDGEQPYFLSGFRWPVVGRVSGVYGSQRILNGQPRQPHNGVDITAPAGTPVLAPADGVVALANPDMYFGGGTLIVDHGHGLYSSFLHLKDIYVTVGQSVKQGDAIASVGATGRATGPHLHWGMNWFQQRIDPALLVPPMERQE